MPKKEPDSPPVGFPPNETPEERTIRWNKIIEEHAEREMAKRDAAIAKRMNRTKKVLTPEEQEHRREIYLRYKANQQAKKNKPPGK